MTKSIEITNGTANIELVCFELGSYFRFNRPLAVNWYDCRGSIAQYFVILPYHEEYRNKIHQKLSSTLNVGKDIDEEILEIIADLLQIFENGNYEISVVPMNTYNEKWRWEIAQNSKPLMQIVDAEIDVETITDSYYDGYSEYFVFTQPSEHIDHERVRHYETQIKAGHRPTVLIYNGIGERKGKHDDGSIWQQTLRSGSFILDGHHKLIAYSNLKITPSLIRIERKLCENNLCLDKKLILDELKPYLHSSQLNHISDHF